MTELTAATFLLDIIRVIYTFLCAQASNDLRFPPAHTAVPNENPLAN